MIATYRNDVAAVDAYICSGDLNRINMHGQVPDSTVRKTPLHVAVCTKNIHLVDFFLGMGADPNMKDSDGNWIIEDASDSAEMLKLLCRHGAHPTQKFQDSIRAVSAAVRKGDAALLKLLLEMKCAIPADAVCTCALIISPMTHTGIQW